MFGKNENTDYLSAQVGYFSTNTSKIIYKEETKKVEYSTTSGKTVIQQTFVYKFI